MTDYEKQMVLEIQHNMENGMRFTEACTEASAKSQLNKIAKEYKKQIKAERRKEKLSEVSDFRDKIYDGFAYGIGYNTARTVAPIVQKAAVKGAKRYIDDHDLDMSEFAEFLEDHTY